MAKEERDATTSEALARESHQASGEIRLLLVFARISTAEIKEAEAKAEPKSKVRRDEAKALRTQAKALKRRKDVATDELIPLCAEVERRGVSSLVELEVSWFGEELRLFERYLGAAHRCIIRQRRRYRSIPMQSEAAYKQPLLSDHDLAKLTGRARSTWQKARLRGDGPVYLKVGRLVKYHPADIETWLAARRRKSTSDPGSATDAA